MKFTTKLLLTSIYCIVLCNLNLSAQDKPNIRTDYHVHLQDSATVQLYLKMLKAFHEKPTHADSIVFDADTIIERLNRAKFHSAWILSNGYLFGSPMVPVTNEYEEVKKQNDWIAAQAEHYPERLKAFMSVNPIKPYALTEIQRCIKTGRFAGLKLHFASSKINLLDKAQLKQLQKVFALANKSRMPMLVHFRNGQKWAGGANTQILLKQLLPFAKNTKVVIAHMAGWGGYDKQTDTALRLIGNYMHGNNPYRNNLYLEVSAVLPLSLNEDYKPGKKNWQVTALKRRINQIGTKHILFGTDWPLIDIGPYENMLKNELGANLVEQIVNNNIDDTVPGK